MTPFGHCIFCMEFSAVMIDRTSSCHSANRSLYKHLLLCIVQNQMPVTASFVTFVESNAKALSTAVPSIKRCCCALRGFCLFQLYSFRYKLRANFIFTCISVYHTFLNTQKSLFYKEIYTFTLITELCSSRIFKVCPYVFSQRFLENLWHFFRHLRKYWLNI